VGGGVVTDGNVQALATKIARLENKISRAILILNRTSVNPFP